MVFCVNQQIKRKQVIDENLLSIRYLLKATVHER